MVNPLHFIDTVIALLSDWVLRTITRYGYAGILGSMAIESACIPLPSEIIMPFSGFLVSEGSFSLWGVTMAGAFGNLLGSWVAYYAGKYGGRRFLENCGHYFFVSEDDLLRADRWFYKYGEATVFVTRMLPVVRTFISLPAGIANMDFLKFSIYSFAGSVPWCFGLALLGKVLGAHWHRFGPYFHQFDFLIVFFLIAALFWMKRAKKVLSK